jgi:hypothetical protein
MRIKKTTRLAGCRMQDTGCRIQDAGYRIQDTTVSFLMVKVK